MAVFSELHKGIRLIKIKFSDVFSPFKTDREEGRANKGNVDLICSSTVD